ncbi:acetyl-coenzyme A carboxylase carboxyl transferase subunit beta [Clostridium acetireducens DSM 10703]|uniref:Acetyl-coenzyme A carboxylase carboxyl transferase subunit beta n=1 Tax=Clostridium acetireducens DSM 10703 TaxID=1121290 RepID=A0A1E8EZS2_9CLOT|nr:acetyl-CoA carboxylase, carboxyltransferase subunit beta [Clostridium acetireducens]OFI06615.1 acetyl-coenzyme A carboxylase carboxyl transferase subunit beta [Clostridium acetireducens DSM 10703]
MIKNLFKRNKYITVSPKVLQEVKNEGAIKPKIPNGMWIKCKRCGQILYKKDLEVNNMVCMNCNYHFRISAIDRINLIIDDKTFTEFDNNIKTANPLNFKDYNKKISNMQKENTINEAVITGIGKINLQPCVVCIMDSNFMMGSMGSVVGEKITRAIEKAIDFKLPVIIFTTSGGARMQEGIFSLMQMAKVSAALSKLNDSGLLYISVLTDPTTGGVTASFAMLGDIILAEPGALVGFAGKRVIEQTINEKLPEEFQRAEFLLKHGFIDKIVERKNLKSILSKLLCFHNNTNRIGGE